MKPARTILAAASLNSAWIVPALVVPPNVNAGITIIWNDTDGAFDGYRADLTSHLQAAVDRWGFRLQGYSDFVISVTPAEESEPFTCHSDCWSYYDTVEGVDFFEPGLSTHLRNGFPASTGHPDVQVTLNPAYLRTHLWFDPRPDVRVDAVAPAKVDAISLFIRGLGTALAFDGALGSGPLLPRGGISSFDRNTSLVNGVLAFTGHQAELAHASPVPLNQRSHYFLQVDAPGGTLSSDVMAGTELVPGARYDISSLDWAILSDSNVPTVPPCGGDLTRDHVVDQYDFEQFAFAYDLWSCDSSEMPFRCPADFNDDGVVDDSDFSMFAVE